MKKLMLLFLVLILSLSFVSATDDVVNLQSKDCDVVITPSTVEFVDGVTRTTFLIENKEDFIFEPAFTTPSGVEGSFSVGSGVVVPDGKKSFVVNYYPSLKSNISFSDAIIMHDINCDDVLIPVVVDYQSDSFFALGMTYLDKEVFSGVKLSVVFSGFFILFLLLLIVPFVNAINDDKPASYIGLFFLWLFLVVVSTLLTILISGGLK